MMGYLWLCEHCDGRGYVTLIQDKFALLQHYKKNAAGDLMVYVGPKPLFTHAGCQVCKGKGYWEP